MRRIGIDARTLNVKGGSKTYADNLLSFYKNKSKYVLFTRVYRKDLFCHKIKLNQQNPVLKTIWEFLILPFLIKKYKIEIFHGLKGFIPPFASCQKIVTVNDLAAFVYPRTSKFPDIIYWRYLIPFYIKKADHIIAISNATKKDIIKYLNISPSKITTIYLGYSKSLFFKKNRNLSYREVRSYLRKKQIKIKRIGEKQIILSVNTIQPRKNISRLIKSFEKIASCNDNAILLLAGKIGWKYEKIIRTYESSNYKDKIFFLGFVPDNILSSLYNISSVLVYPSFYEGFGLPIIEAQACGCPVITSNVSSMPEIAGKAAILVNPQSEKEIADAINTIIKDNKLRKKLIKVGFENAQKFSWKKCAQETKRLYKKYLNRTSK